MYYSKLSPTVHDRVTKEHGNRFYEGETEPGEKEPLVLKTKTDREGTRGKRIQRKLMFSCIPVTDMGKLSDNRMCEAY